MAELMDAAYPELPASIAGSVFLFSLYVWMRYLTEERHWHPLIWLHIHLPHKPKHKFRH